MVGEFGTPFDLAWQDKWQWMGCGDDDRREARDR
jgi:hypothetical protein